MDTQVFAKQDVARRKVEGVPSRAGQGVAVLTGDTGAGKTTALL